MYTEHSYASKKKIYNEYKSNNPEGLAGATSTSATAGAVTIPSDQAKPKIPLFSNQHVLLMIIFIIEYCKLRMCHIAC